MRRVPCPRLNVSMAPPVVSPLGLGLLWCSRPGCMNAAGTAAPQEETRPPPFRDGSPAGPRGPFDGDADLVLFRLDGDLDAGRLVAPVAPIDRRVVPVG